jgi:hypothetical protein
MAVGRCVCDPIVPLPRGFFNNVKRDAVAYATRHFPEWFWQGARVTRGAADKPGMGKLV